MSWREDAGVLAHILHFFEIRGRPMPERPRVQALVPDGATVLPNALGCAPGLAIQLRQNHFRADSKTTWLLMLPGPPRELRPMFLDSVVPLLRRQLPLREPFFCRTLRTVGIGESLVQEQIAGPLKPLVEAGLDLGYCARPGQVDVRLAARGPGARDLLVQAEQIVRPKL